jgi:endoplasmic reticulum resident protein 44
LVLQEYSDLVKRELLSERQQVNFLTADGVKFAHPLHHLGKSKEDLPLIAVDSFRNGCVERPLQTRAS